ncbi:MAG: D-tyrosyl-tRNA(Tyr) deacylase [Deferribacteraceae bacterium]|jgi:D-tyrosyl-tRNA(Tyr) deacylase|nr:D-tyrosyl-tRNA(Tyr) deacylase [Deferribacteraceae bacterium]
MIAVVQRVLSASVTVDGSVISSIEQGLLVLLGVEKGDGQAQADKVIKKLANLRIFSNDEGKMSLSVKDISGALLLVSQFTLAGNTDKGNRPDFFNAAPPEEARALYEYVAAQLAKELPTQAGIFGADMKVALVNDGPVTILVKA